MQPHNNEQWSRQQRLQLRNRQRQSILNIKMTEEQASQHLLDRWRGQHTRIHAIEWSHIKCWQNTGLHTASANQQAMTRTTVEKDLCLTGVISKVSVSRRSNLDTGEVGDGRSDASTDVSMEMALAATLIAAETVSANTFEPIERNGNGKRRKTSKALATPFAPNDWMSRKQRTMRQQAQELTQLHQTVGHLAYLLVAQATHEESQL